MTVGKGIHGGQTKGDNKDKQTPPCLSCSLLVPSLKTVAGGVAERVQTPESLRRLKMGLEGPAQVIRGVNRVSYSHPYMVALWRAGSHLLAMPVFSKPLRQRPGWPRIGPSLMKWPGSTFLVVKMARACGTCCQGLLSTSQESRLPFLRVSVGSDRPSNQLKSMYDN